MLDPHGLVFGHGKTSGIVALETDLRGGTATLYRRVDGATVREVVPLRLWMVGRKQKQDELELEGPHPLRWLLDGADGYRILEAARSLASDQRLAYFDPVAAHLTRSGDTFFRGMQFSELRRLQFDLETLDIYPDRAGAEICIISVRDSSGFERVLGLDEFENERALIEAFAAIVRERDPDVIEGHNIFNFDLWYLAERAKRSRAQLALGRDGRSPLFFDESIRRTLPNGLVTKYYRIEGRQIVDTFYGAMRWDISRRLPNYKLKHIVRHLGIGDEERAMVDAANMRALWADSTERAKLKAYCLDDARDVDRLSRLVTPNEFYQTQMVPESLQGIAFVGIGSRIERLMVRAYLRAGHSIPRPRPVSSIEGGFTAAFETGVFYDVVKCDVESLYPSLMLAQAIAPQDDDLGVFLPMLASLRDRRVAAKREAEHARGVGDRAALLAADGLQQAFKILINSFYGFLGTNNLHFNDPAAAARVTEAGRAVMERIVSELRSRGCTVIEADTDGAFFALPSGADPEAIVAQVGATLGEGVRLVCEERYAAMLSLKAKNYALQRAGGDFVMRGSALRSGRDEPFGRTLVQEISEALISRRPHDIAGIVRAALQRVREGELDVLDFSRRETVTSRTFTSAGNRRLAQALTERGVSIGDKVRVYQRKNGELALSEEYAQDEDRDHLVRRVVDFVARFGDLIPPDARAAAGEAPDQLSLL